MGHPSCRSSSGKMSPQGIWLWKPARLTLERPRQLQEMEATILKGSHKISCAVRPRAEAVIWRSLGQLHLLILETSQRGRRQLRSHPGTINPGSRHIGDLILWMDTNAGKCHFGIPLLTLLVPGASPTHQRSHNNCKKQLAQPAEPGSALSTLTPIVADPNKQKDTAHTGATLEALNSGGRGEYAAGIRRASLT